VKELTLTIKAGEREFSVSYTSRELKFLGGPLLPAGSHFTQSIEMWDNFTVAKGQDTSAWTIKRRTDVLAVARDLLTNIKEASDLFAYDYQYGFSSSSKIRNTGGTTVTVNGTSGIIDARQPGQIYFRDIDGGVVDLRLGEPCETNHGTLKIHRRRNAIDWLPKLQSLIDFLENLKAETVEIRHH
jgi:hypothetical protein